MPEYKNQLVMSLQHLNPDNIAKGFPIPGGTSLGLAQKAHSQNIPNENAYVRPGTTLQSNNGITNESRVMLVGHGSPGGTGMSGQYIDGTPFTVSCEQMAAQIASQYQQTSSNQRLKVSLVACNGGVRGPNGEPSLGERVCECLYQNHGIEADVTARMGYVQRYLGGEYKKLVTDPNDNMVHQGENYKQTFRFDSQQGGVVGQLHNTVQPLAFDTHKDGIQLASFMESQFQQGWTADPKYGESIVSQPFADKNDAMALAQQVQDKHLSYKENVINVFQSPTTGHWRVFVPNENIRQEQKSQAEFTQRLTQAAQQRQQSSPSNPRTPPPPQPQHRQPLPPNPISRPLPTPPTSKASDLITKANNELSDLNRSWQIQPNDNREQYAANMRATLSNIEQSSGSEHQKLAQLKEVFEGVNRIQNSDANNFKRMTSEVWSTIAPEVQALERELGPAPKPPEPVQQSQHHQQLPPRALPTQTMPNVNDSMTSSPPTFQHEQSYMQIPSRQPLPGEQQKTKVEHNLWKLDAQKIMGEYQAKRSESSAKQDSSGMFFNQRRHLAKKFGNKSDKREQQINELIGVMEKIKQTPDKLDVDRDQMLMIALDDLSKEIGQEGNKFSSGLGELVQDYKDTLRKSLESEPYSPGLQEIVSLKQDVQKMRESLKQEPDSPKQQTPRNKT